MKFLGESARLGFWGWIETAAERTSGGTQSEPSPSRQTILSRIKSSVYFYFRHLRSAFRSFVPVFLLGKKVWHSLVRILDRLLLRVQSSERNFYRLDITPIMDRFSLNILHDLLCGRVANFSERAQFLESLIANYGNSVSALDLESAYGNFISALVHCQYLIGYVDEGGAKTYNSGSLEFRATYVSLLLFKAAYFWVWFREVASRKVSRTQRNGKFSKWEPKFKPPREKDARGRSQGFQCLRLGGYDTEWAAMVVCQIARFYYKKDNDLVKLEPDGFEFVIPPMTEQERGLTGQEKWNLVSDKAKDVFEHNFKKAHDRYMTIQRDVEQDVELPTEQGWDNVLHDHTRLPQPLSDLAAILDAASTGIEATPTGSGVEDYDFQMPEILPSPNIRERSSALLPDSAVSGADAIAGEALIFRAGVDDINKFGEGQGTPPNHAAIGTAHPSGALTNLEASKPLNVEAFTSQPSEKWRQAYQEIMSGDIQLPTQQDAGHVVDLDDHTLETTTSHIR